MALSNAAVGGALHSVLSHKGIKNFQGSLLSDAMRVQAPFIKVDIGRYTFGIYQEQKRTIIGNNGIWVNASKTYPNYIQSLHIKKINGTVNTYTLNIIYPITQDNDPNFFEKVFSSVSDTRKIIFTYGDSMLPEDVYANESALITEITSNLNVDSASISYTVTAIGDTAVSLASNYSHGPETIQPSKKIAQLIRDKRYNLTNIFYGMKDKDPYNFIDGDDKPVFIPAVANKPIMDYIATLVSYMTPNGSATDSVIQGSIYTLSTHEDTTGEVGGPYFEVRKVASKASATNQCSYIIDIGYPTANVVESFQIKQSNNWSIFYNYNKNNSLGNYVNRLSDTGKIEKVYNPQLTDGKFDLENNDKTWWTRVTEFPIEATITINGLLKPAILMNYVKINVWFYGRKHITSGVYLISGEEDDIGMSGYKTTLSLIRVGPDDDFDAAMGYQESSNSSSTTNSNVNKNNPNSIAKDSLASRAASGANSGARK